MKSVVMKCVIIGWVFASFVGKGFSAELKRPMPDELQLAFNKQINAELEGAQIYLNLANYFYQNSWDGFGSWFTAQYYEELNHMRQLMIFMNTKAATVELDPVAAPPKIEPSFHRIFQDALELEETQTGRIHELYNLAESLKAHDAVSFLKFFVDEQVQEENSFSYLEQKLKLAGDTSASLLIIDADLAKRVLPVIAMPVPRK